MRILITGASGFVGSHLCKKLENEGNNVVCFSRRGGISDNLAVFTGPAKLSLIENSGPWPRDIEALIHLAAKIPANQEGSSDEADIFESNVEWTRALAARACVEGVKRIIFLSTANVHGSGRETPYSEDDRLDPPNIYAKSKKAAEEAFWQALGGDRAIGTILRPSPVFGKGGHGPVAALVKLAKTRVPLPMKGIGGPRSLIAVDHLVDIISLCLTREAACGETFLVADEGPMRPEDIIRAVRRGLNRSPALLPTPANMLRLAAMTVGQGERWETRTRPYALNTARLKTKLGWHSPMAAETMQIMTEAGEL